MAKKRKYIIWILIVGSIFTGGFLYFSSQKSTDQYTTESAKIGSLAQTVSATGKVVSNSQAEISFKIGGKLRSIDVNAGDSIKKGKILASLETGMLGAELARAREQVKFQEKTLENMKKRDDVYISKQRSAQRAQIRSAEAGVSAILAQFGDTRLYSPIDGVVLKRNIEVGEIVSPSLPVLVVGNLGDLIVESNVPESDIVKIKLGQKADISFDAFPSDKFFAGEVIFIDAISTVIQDVVYYKVKLKLDEIDTGMKIGMSVDIDFKITEKGGIITIPLRAVKTEDAKKYVEVLVNEEKNLIERRLIEIGLEGDGGLIEIKSGIKEGERVVTFLKSQE